MAEGYLVRHGACWALREARCSRSLVHHRLPAGSYERN